MNAAELQKVLIQLIESKAQTAAGNDRFIYATVNDSMLYVRVKDIRFISDDILVFDGHDSDGNKYMIIQHVSQLSMCIAEKALPARLRKNPEVIRFPEK